ncbi:helix-turn-helix transcriptional regulator [Bremerella sp. P1]|uniref:helix-turn-helix transcriptional regulator n=1 Tax=Bremerella sp. P1 TaxID=3026424 RepID=UPI002368E23E|nr:helix-turn-helix transcriptional regulator [Bremerella sp. P1]WDI42450.1 helix-turn-helix transcriptional regulator [Bremerella sp. P1]
MNRAYACNRDFLRHLRLQNGWTQADLAKRAGYSERLISKAEAGVPIARDTIVDLADAFSEINEEPIYWEDLASDPIQLAQRYLDTIHFYQKDSVDHLLDFLDQDVVFRIAGDPAQIPFAGEHSGIDGVRKFFDIFFTVLEVPKDHDYNQHYQVMGQGPNAIIWGESWIHPIGQPMDQPIRVSNLLVFRRGKLVLLDDCYDTAAGAARLNGSSKG